MSAPPQFVGLVASGPFASRSDFTSQTCKPKPDAPAGWEVQRGIIVPGGTVKRRTSLRRIPYKSGKPVSMRIVVDFSVNGPLNMKLWNKLKLPKGWAKCPRTGWKNESKYPVRLRTYQPLSLSAEELSNIQAQLALMEIA